VWFYNLFMNQATGRTTGRAAVPGAAEVGCVSFLNSKPLIDGAQEILGPVRFEVPSRLLELLLRREVKIALCPVIDFQLSPAALKVVPVGGICCRGQTLTVRVFGQKPLQEVKRVYADTDSHTSVNLMCVVFKRLFGTRVEVLPLNEAGEGTPECVLLIGDKVVTREPSRAVYPYQLDLGEAWHEMTGEPFVFATWLALEETDLGDLPAKLKTLREGNAGRIDAIVAQYAVSLGWDAGRAREYLGRLLHYEVGEAELRAMEYFWKEAHALGLIGTLRPMKVCL
jgi:chorismate dehydratase